jgi:hypothetical protein
VDNDLLYEFWESKVHAYDSKSLLTLIQNTFIVRIKNACCKKKNVVKNEVDRHEPTQEDNSV